MLYDKKLYQKKFKGRKKTEIVVSETKNFRAVVYTSETVHKARKFEVATKIFLFFILKLAY